MIKINDNKCPYCNGVLKYYDSVRRVVKGKNGKKKYVIVHRFRCSKCNSIHRELPSYILPYKLYEADIIMGVINGTITSWTVGYEDYPCETTMQRWIHTRK